MTHFDPTLGLPVEPSPSRLVAPSGTPVAASRVLRAGRYSFNWLLTVRTLEPSLRETANADLARALNETANATNVQITETLSGPQRYTASPDLWADEWFVRIAGTFDLPADAPASTSSGGVYRGLARGIFRGLSLRSVQGWPTPADGSQILARALADDFISLPRTGTPPRDTFVRVAAVVTRTGDLPGQARATPRARDSGVTPQGTQGGTGGQQGQGATNQRPVAQVNIDPARHGVQPGTSTGTTPQGTQGGTGGQQGQGSTQGGTGGQQGQGSTQGGTGSQTPPPPPPSRSRWWVYALGGLAGVGLAILAGGNDRR